MCWAILFSLSDITLIKFSNHILASSIDLLVISLILSELIFIQSASSFNLCPLHFSQFDSLWYWEISSLFHSLSVSRNLLSKLFITPSKLFFVVYFSYPSSYENLISSSLCYRFSNLYRFHSILCEYFSEMYNHMDSKENYYYLLLVQLQQFHWSNRGK